MISRYYDKLDEQMIPKRVTILYGARRTGKTTLIENYLATKADKKILRATGDDMVIQNFLSVPVKNELTDWVGNNEIVFIDEAQKIKNIGESLKILIDENPQLNIIVTGSASFEILNKVGEPLTGRQTPLTLYPVSLTELLQDKTNVEVKQDVENYLIYGMYPEVLSFRDKNDKIRILNELSKAYLLKDILELENIKSSKTLNDLLILLAMQIGSEVSHNELSNKLGIDKKTVGKYLDLLEKSFIIYNLRGFSRKLRNEITKKTKYYFYDLGIRNALISNFNPLKIRKDVGGLWENFCVIERLKMRSYKNIYGNAYFWRTWEQKEIDLIEERDGVLHTFECKWNPKKDIKIPKEFSQEYPNSKFDVVNNGNFLDYLS